MMILPDQRLAITDIETTGTEPFRFKRRFRNLFQPQLEPWHEIVEIGLVVVDSGSWFAIEQWSIKVKPSRINTATKKALEINGYNADDWRDAATLKEAARLYAEKTKGAIFAAHNVTFDWSFLELAFKETGINYDMGYRKLDMCTLACTKLDRFDLSQMSQDNIAVALGLKPEPRPHRALNGAVQSWKIYRELASK